MMLKFVFVAIIAVAVASTNRVPAPGRVPVPCPHTTQSVVVDITTPSCNTLVGTLCIDKCVFDTVTQTMCFRNEASDPLVLDENGFCPSPPPPTTDTNGMTPMDSTPPPCNCPGTLVCQNNAAGSFQACVDPTTTTCTCVAKGDICSLDSTGVSVCTTPPTPPACPKILCPEITQAGCHPVFDEDGCRTCAYKCDCICPLGKICDTPDLTQNTLAGTTIPTVCVDIKCTEGDTRPAPTCPHGLVDTCDANGNWVGSKALCPDEHTCPPVVGTPVSCPLKPGCYYLSETLAVGACPKNDCDRPIFCPPSTCSTTKPCVQNEICVLPKEFSNDPNANAATLTANTLLEPSCACQPGTSYFDSNGRKCTCDDNRKNICVDVDTTKPCVSTEQVFRGCNECPCDITTGRRYCLEAKCQVCLPTDKPINKGQCEEYGCVGGIWIPITKPACVEPPSKPVIDPSTKPCWKCEPVIADASVSGASMSNIAARPLACTFDDTTCPPRTQCDEIFYNSINEFRIQSLEDALTADTDVISTHIDTPSDGSVRVKICQKVPEDQPEDTPVPLPEIIQTNYVPASTRSIGSNAGNNGSSSATSITCGLGLIAVIALVIM